MGDMDMGDLDLQVMSGPDKFFVEIRSQFASLTFRADRIRLMEIREKIDRALAGSRDAA